MRLQSHHPQLTGSVVPNLHHLLRGMNLPLRDKYPASAILLHILISTHNMIGGGPSDAKYPDITHQEQAQPTDDGMTSS